VFVRDIIVSLFFFISGISYKIERRTILEDSAELEKIINQKLKESGQPRVKRVDYYVELFDKDFPLVEADLLFGTKK
jgi:hypothetical protein